MADTQTECIAREKVGNLTKLITKPLHVKKGNKKSQVGDLTKEYIDINADYRS